MLRHSPKHSARTLAMTFWLGIYITKKAVAQLSSLRAFVVWRSNLPLRRINCIEQIASAQPQAQCLHPRNDASFWLYVSKKTASHFPSLRGTPARLRREAISRFEEDVRMMQSAYRKCGSDREGMGNIWVLLTKDKRRMNEG